jgi:hypothetical protein
VREKVKLFDTNCEHHGFGNSISCFPGYTFQPSLIETVRDRNFKSDKAIFTDNCLSDSVNDDSNVKIAVLLEPRALVPGVYENILKYEDNFQYIFTHDHELLKRKGKYLPYLFGGLWAKPEDLEKYKQIKRKRKICIVVSGKKSLPGQILRHQIISVFSQKYQIDVFGNGYRPVENIGDVFCNYEYSIVVENVQDGYWITEKPITPLFCGSKILYYGSNKIGEFFPDKLLKETDFILPFDTLEELESLIMKCMESNREDIPHIADWILQEKMNCTEDWIWKNYFS